MGELLPDLLLTGMVVGHCERHQLFQRHAVAGVDVEEFRGDRGKLQPLLDDRRAHEEAGRDVLFAQSLLAQGLETPQWAKGFKGFGRAVYEGEIPLPRPPVRPVERPGWGLLLRFLVARYLGRLSRP